MLTKREAKELLSLLDTNTILLRERLETVALSTKSKKEREHERELQASLRKLAELTGKNTEEIKEQLKIGA